MKAPEGFAQQARQRAEDWLSSGPNKHNMTFECVLWAFAWGYRRQRFVSREHATNFWLLLAELADDGQEAPE